MSARYMRSRMSNLRHSLGKVFSHLACAMTVFCQPAFAAAQETQSEAGSLTPPEGGAPGVGGAGDQAETQALTSGSGTVLSSLMEPFEYDPQGRKDPFQIPMLDKPLPPGAVHGPVLPLQKFALEELALTGVIWDVSRPRAMVKDPSGRIHVLGPYAKVGNQNGYIAVIREGEIVVIETREEDGKLLSAPRIVKLVTGAAGPGSTAAAGPGQGKSR